MASKGNKEKEKEKERRTVCVGCKKNFTKSDFCVICGSCSYWYHKTCAGMTEDVFKCVDQHFKDNGTVSHVQHMLRALHRDSERRREDWKQWRRTKRNRMRR
jgi:hypothetical protein